jgi:hypothetical protein
LQVFRSESGLHGALILDDIEVTELRPAVETTLYATLPDQYGQLLRVGAWYEIQRAGGDIEQWVWGTKEDYKGQIVPPAPKIALPAGARFRY